MIETSEIELAERLIDTYGSRIKQRFESLTKQSFRPFLLNKAIENGFKELTDRQTRLVLNMFDYVGAFESKEFYPESIGARSFRKAEENFILQLILMKFETDEAFNMHYDSFGTSNDTVYAYKKGYSVYGYFRRDSRDTKPIYMVDIRSFNGWPYSKNKYPGNGKIDLKLLENFSKYCRRAGITKIRIEEHLLKNDEQGDEILRRGFQILGGKYSEYDSWKDEL